MHAIIAGLVLLGGLAESLTVRSAAKAPALDGRIGAKEYGAPAVRMPLSSGEATVRVARHGGYVYIAATLPDTSVYWGDDFVVSLDANGSGGEAPDVGDRQWYLRRVLDSSVVFTVDAAARGRWLPPGTTPPLIGATRHNAAWDVAATSSRAEWSVELRIKESLFVAGSPPRISFRTYNDKPRGWFSWPQALDGKPLSVERAPAQWIRLHLR